MCIILYAWLYAGAVVWNRVSVLVIRHVSSCVCVANKTCGRHARTLIERLLLDSPQTNDDDDGATEPLTPPASWYAVTHTHTIPYSVGVFVY